MIKTIEVLVFMAISIQAVFSLTCYSCYSPTSTWCMQFRNHKTQVCGLAAPGYKSLCSYIESYDPYRKTYNVSAGCHLASYHDSITTIRNKLCLTSANKNVNRCILCDQNYCNSIYY